MTERFGNGIRYRTDMVAIPDAVTVTVTVLQMARIISVLPALVLGSFSLKPWLFCYRLHTARVTPAVTG